MSSAINAGDARRYAAVYAPDATITIHGGSLLRGREAIEQYEVGLLNEFPGTRFAILAVWQHGDSAVVHYGVTTPLSGGRTVGHEGLLFYVFRPSGLVGEEVRYLDAMTPIAQMGLLGPGPVRAPPVLSPTVSTYASSAEPDNVAVARGFLGAVEARDETRVLGLLSPDVVIDELIEPHPFRGIVGARRWLQQWTNAAPDAHVEIVSIVGIGEFVIVESAVRGTLLGPLGRVPAGDLPMSIHRAQILRINGGRVVNITSFVNGKELAESVGRWPPREPRALPLASRINSRIRFVQRGAGARWSYGMLNRYRREPPCFVALVFEEDGRIKATIDLTDVTRLQLSTYYDGTRGLDRWSDTTTHAEEQWDEVAAESLQTALATCSEQGGEGREPSSRSPR